MTDLVALRALHDAVKAGVVKNGSFRCMPRGTWLDAGAAYGGSLDAAHALHKAVLPGTRWDVFWLEGAVHGCNLPHQDTEYADNPARAWLLAILAALIAQQEGE